LNVKSPEPLLCMIQYALPISLHSYSANSSGSNYLSFIEKCGLVEVEIRNSINTGRLIKKDYRAETVKVWRQIKTAVTLWVLCLVPCSYRSCDSLIVM